MKRSLTLLAGLVLVLAGIVRVVAEIDSGQDIWRRYSGIGWLVLGVLLLLGGWGVQR